jgi:N utilization substance protein B
VSANRHLGRIIALQTLYEFEFRFDCEDKNLKLSEVLGRNLGRYDKALQDVKFVKDLVAGVQAETADIDVRLQPIAPERPIKEIARMDRMILRIAAYELLHNKETPAKVVINEAVELAKSFGGENSSKFINGALGALLKEVDPEQAKAATNKPQSTAVPETDKEEKA